MTKDRIEKAVEVINYAIEHNISVKEASKKCGYADTYVKNVKAVLQEKYEAGTIEDELFSLFMDAYEEYENGKKETAPDETIVSNAPKNLPKEVEGEQTTYTERGTNASFEWRGNDNHFKHIKSVDDLLDAADVDLDVWKIKNYLVNKWDVTSWKQGYPETIQNFQVKATLERVEELFKYKKAAELFIEMIQDYEPPQFQVLPKVYDKMPTNYKFLEKENNMLEICIFDLHIGKLAWAGETGENYDVKIASKRFMDALQMILYRASCFTYKKILFPVGND